MSFDLMNDLGVMAIARVPEWKRLGAIGSGHSHNAYTGVPATQTSGITLATNEGFAIRTLFLVSPRERAHAHRSRVRVTTVDDTATYTATLGESGAQTLDHDYAATGGDAEPEILAGLRDSINTGVDLGALGGANLTFADANPDTITRSAGDWTTDGVNVGDRVTPTGTASNDVTYTVAGVTTTVLTLVANDAVVAEGPVAVTAFVVQRPVQATVEDRDGDGTDDTLVVERIDVDEEIDDPTNDFTTTVSATGSGALEFDEDATSFDLQVWLLPAGQGSVKQDVEQLWTIPPSSEFTGIDYKGRSERVDTAGFSRQYQQISNITNPSGDSGDATIQNFVGPAILETR